MPEGTSIGVTSDAVRKVEHWLHEQPEANIVTSYIGQGAPRFYMALSPELPDPSFAKIVVLTPNATAREALKHRLRQVVADGFAPEARIRVTQIVFGPPSPFPVAFRVMGPDESKVRAIAEEVRAAMAGMQEQATKDRLALENDEAIRKGVFGSPFFIADGVPFWGSDRMGLMTETGTERTG